MDSALTSEIERYLQLEQQGLDTKEEWENLIEKISDEDLDRILEGTWGLNEVERMEFLKSPAEIHDSHRDPYTRFDDFSMEYLCSKCGYHCLDTWKQVVFNEGDPECKHDERPYAVRPIIILDFDRDGKVTQDTVKEARKAVKDILEKWVFDAHLPASFYVEKQGTDEKCWKVMERYSDEVIESFKIEEEARARAIALREEAKRRREERSRFIKDHRQAVIDYYREFKQALGPSLSPLSKELRELIEAYDPNLVRRVVRANAKTDIVDKGVIGPTNNTKNRNRYAWCLAVFRVARINPSLANVPGVKTIERISYPSRSKKTP